MSTIVEKEISALRRIYENNLYNPVNKDCIGPCIQEMRLSGDFVVVLDVYQLCRELSIIPEQTEWDVDMWEACKVVVYWGRLDSRARYRFIMVAAQVARERLLADLRRPCGCSQQSPMQPSMKGRIERAVHRSQRRLRTVFAGV